MTEYQCDEVVAGKFSEGLLNMVDKRCSMEHQCGNAVAHNFSDGVVNMLNKRSCTIGHQCGKAVVMGNSICWTKDPV